MKYEAIKKFVGENIRYKDWEFHVKRKGQTMYLQIQFQSIDNKFEYFNPDGGDLGRGPFLKIRHYGRKWQLSNHMTKTEIVRTAHLAVIQAEIHESCELFKYKGIAIFNTHRDIDELAALKQIDIRK